MNQVLDGSKALFPFVAWRFQRPWLTGHGSQEARAHGRLGLTGDRGSRETGAHRRLGLTGDWGSQETGAHRT
jgi:hypothetical protein